MNSFDSLPGLEGIKPSWCFVARIFEHESNALTVVIVGARVSAEPTQVDDVGVTLEGRQIETSGSLPGVELVWDSYISYAVRNESYVALDLSEDSRGSVVTILRDSKFLRFVAEATFANPEYPGPFSHYHLSTGDHIIDIASEVAPVISRVQVEDFTSRTRHFVAI